MDMVSETEDSPIISALTIQHSMALAELPDVVAIIY
jgi:hypothetical protein